MTGSWWDFMGTLLPERIPENCTSLETIHHTVFFNNDFVLF